MRRVITLGGARLRTFVKLGVRLGIVGQGWQSIPRVIAGKVARRPVTDRRSRVECEAWTWTSCSRR
jgi:hypothetical protein